MQTLAKPLISISSIKENWYPLNVNESTLAQTETDIKFFNVIWCLNVYIFKCSKELILIKSFSRNSWWKGATSNCQESW